MVQFLRRLLKSSYQPLNKILISRDQLIENYRFLMSFNERIRIAPVLKSNAYGHGLIQIAPVIDQLKPPFICVDSLPEANILKKLGVKSEVLIMGSVAKESLKNKLPFHLTVTSIKMLENIITHQPHAPVHLFIDTGMNREGVMLEELDEVLVKIKHSKLNLVGVMTHLAISTDQNHPLTKKQIKNFQLAIQKIKNAEFSPKWTHIGGSDSITWITPEIANLVRCGRLLYGVQSLRLKELKPVAQLQTTVIQTKSLRKGESVGYSATFTAQKDMTVAVLPIGYNDGLDRRLSNRGVVIINDIECPVIGLVSMNMTVVDISRIKVEVGDKVLVFSSDPNKKNSFEQSAELADTNPSDLLVGLHPSTRREVI